MYHAKLRRAIATAYPDRYNFFTWKSLLADFVDEQIHAYLGQCEIYNQQKALNPEITPPLVTAELQEAVTLLARQKKHSYTFLALTHYLLQWEVAAGLKSIDHYRQQVEGYQRLMMDYRRLADAAIAQTGQADNP